jgi:hypothetical protein
MFRRAETFRNRSHRLAIVQKAHDQPGEDFAIRRKSPKHLELHDVARRMALGSAETPELRTIA